VAAKELSRLFPSPVASDDAVLPQLCDGGGVEAEPVGEHLGGVLADAAAIGSIMSSKFA